MIKKNVRRLASLRLPMRLVRVSWRDLWLTLGPVLVIVAVGTWIALQYVRPAPPDTVIITSGAEDSTFRRTAEKYRDILARSGVKLQILPSQGSLENLQRLKDPAFNVDVGFVQGGLASEADTEGLESLGSIYFEPLWVFSRCTKPIKELSELRGKRIAIGPEKTKPECSLCNCSKPMASSRRPRRCWTWADRTPQTLCANTKRTRLS